VLREQQAALTAPYPWAACRFEIAPASSLTPGQSTDAVAEVGPLVGPVTNMQQLMGQRCARRCLYKAVLAPVPACLPTAAR
jgi:hypothetical protein